LKHRLQPPGIPFGHGAAGTKDETFRGAKLWQASPARGRR
jgi:hypothetical protein